MTTLTRYESDLSAPPPSHAFAPPAGPIVSTQFSRNARITHRGFAVELSSRLLAEAWPWESNSGVDSPGGGERNGSGGRSPVSPTAGDVVPVEGNGDAGESSPGVLADGGGKTMLDVVVARAWDRAPTVR